MKKIMFSDAYGLTEAVLSGRKTQTRRIIKPQPTFNENHGIVWRGFAYGLSLQLDEIKGSCKNFITGTEYDKSCNRYRVGEVVAVAQSYEDAGVDFIPEEDEEFGCYNFPAEQTHGWTNKLYVRSSLMPHRIRITNVRLERLQDIPDEDCIKEGIGISDTNNRIGRPFGIPFNYYAGEDKKGCRYSTPREAYAALIDRISGKGTWNSNPYVFVYDFELVK